MTKFWLKATTLPEAIKEIANITQHQIDTLEKKAAENIPIVQAIKPYPSLGGYEINSAKSSYNGTVTLNHSSSWFTFKGYVLEVEPTLEQLEARYKNIQDVIDALEKGITLVDEDNKLPIENNKKIQEKVTLMMQHVGIKPTYSILELPSSRSRTKKWVTKSAGYTSDLARDIPISAGSKPDVKNLRTTAERMYKEKLAKVQAAQRVKEQAEKAASQVHEIALLRAVYTPDDAMSSISDILGEMISKNKYLYLSHYLRKNRGDWNDGYDYAECGLNGFSIETPTDQEIYDDISSNFGDGWHGDGRCFRDCTWNYDVIYSLVEDEKLIRDYNKILELCGDN